MHQVFSTKNFGLKKTFSLKTVEVENEIGKLFLYYTASFINDLNFR